MLRFSKAIPFALAAAASLACGSVRAQADEDARAPGQRPVVALMGTIPIYWGEAAGFEEVLAGTMPAHWARSVLEREVELAPLDYLSAEALAPHGLLLLAQPRGLSGEENVALDAWVRAGGQLLLFTDPLMTGESRFHIGDRRRPQDVALLSPILGHWGLELRYDPAQESGLNMREFAGHPYPVNQAGELVVTASDNAACLSESAGLAAWCSIGSGHATIIADAALLDVEGPYDGSEPALARALAQGLGIMREDSDTTPHL